MPATGQDAQVLYSVRTFRTLLDALARPGSIKQLQHPQFLDAAPSDDASSTTSTAQVNMYALGALLSLLDKETSFAIAAHGRWLPMTDALVQWIVLRSGSNPAPAEQAAFALLCDNSDGELLTHLNPGTLLEPESSATAMYCIEQLAITGEGLMLELRGPGIETTHAVNVRGLSRAHIEEINASRCNYPLGVDVYLVDRDGRCLGLPRTTRINVDATIA